RDGNGGGERDRGGERGVRAQERRTSRQFAVRKIRQRLVPCACPCARTAGRGLSQARQALLIGSRVRQWVERGKFVGLWVALSGRAPKCINSQSRVRPADRVRGRDCVAGIAWPGPGSAVAWPGGRRAPAELALAPARGGLHRSRIGSPGRALVLTTRDW